MFWLENAPPVSQAGKAILSTDIGSFSEDTVVVDGKVITSRGAGAAGYFALALVEALYGEEKAAEVKSTVVMDIVEKNLGL